MTKEKRVNWNTTFPIYFIDALNAIASKQGIPVNHLIEQDMMKLHEKTVTEFRKNQVKTIIPPQR